ncbi:phosphate/phosphite/phosphonate ABC transporter substrate-binding protein [Aliidongia dinghuensis]|nr:PhnD/SsuA/transferrin family substrate-binding protein [Aliidongia dinghuensis]
MTLVANARMYAATPAAAAAWKLFFRWLADKSGVDLAVIDYAFPAPLAALWSRPDLGAAFMCGFPFVRSQYRPKPLAAPIPAGARYAGRPVYMTDLVVRADAPYRTLEDTFGGRLGYTVEDSHSGYNALRHHLLPYRSSLRPALYGKRIGPLYTPRRVLEAIIDGTIDLGPLDGYALDLTKRHEPAVAQRVRTLATTDPAPIPFLIASADCPDEIVHRLRSALLSFGDDPRCAELRDALCLAGFAPVVEADYALIAAWDQEAQAAGYSCPA